MQLTRVKCWYVGDAMYDVAQVSAQAHTLDLVKKSILKTGYRAYCLTDRAEITRTAQVAFPTKGMRIRFDPAQLFCAVQIFNGGARFFGHGVEQLRQQFVAQIVLKSAKTADESIEPFPQNRVY